MSGASRIVTTLLPRLPAGTLRNHLSTGRGGLPERHVRFHGDPARANSRTRRAAQQVAATGIAATGMCALVTTPGM